MNIEQKYIIFYRNGNLYETINRYLLSIVYIVLQKKNHNIEYKFICSEDCPGEIIFNSYKFIDGFDTISDYIFLKKLTLSEILCNDNINGFNTLGIFKNEIDQLIPFHIRYNMNGGVYLKNINIIKSINDFIDDTNISNNNLNTILSINFKYSEEILYDIYNKYKTDILDYIIQHNDWIYIDNNKYYINTLIDKNIISKDTLKISKISKLKIIIITLKEYGIRSNELIENLNELGIEYEIFNGVNGKNIQIQNTEHEHIKLLYYELNATFYDMTKRLNGNIMTNGELGAAWSHMNIYKKLLKDDNYDNYIILEDDSLINTTIEHFKTLLLNIPDKFDIIHIAKSEWFNFIKISNVNDYYYNIEHNFFSCAGGYIISKVGANKLLNISDGWINIPADDLLSNNFMLNNIDVIVPENYVIYESETNNKSIIKDIN